MNAYPVDVEIELSRGIERFDIVGMADIAVKESRERIKSAFRSSEIRFPSASIVVNLAPADVRKAGSVHDLAVAVAMLETMGEVQQDISEAVFIGELSLGGEVRGVNGVLPMTISAQKSGVTKIFVPKDNAFEASVVEGIEVYGVSISERRGGYSSHPSLCSEAGSL